MRSGLTLGGRFVLGEELEHDIPGVTRFLARDQRLERDAVVDVLATLSPAAIRREATRASSLRDPRLTRIVTAGRDDEGDQEVSFVAYEDVPGVRLSDVLAERRLDTRLAVAVIGGAARGLTVARTAGLHHGFLRPGALTVTGRGRVVVSGVGVDGEAAWQARLTPLRSEAGDAAALTRILIECLTGIDPDDATAADLPQDLSPRARDLITATLDGSPPTTLDAVIDALSPFDSRALMGFARAVDQLPLTPERQEREDRLADQATRKEQAHLSARQAASRGIVAAATLAAASQGAEVEVAHRRGDGLEEAMHQASEDLRREHEEALAAERAAAEAAALEAEAAAQAAAEEERRVAAAEAATDAVPVVSPPEEDVADKYEAGFNALETMVAEQHAARTPGTWELVLSRLHEQWPRSEAITRSLARARERANSGGPLNGARITLLLAIIGLGVVTWFAWGWLQAPLSPDIDIEQTTPPPSPSAPASTSPTPSPDASS